MNFQYSKDKEGFKEEMKKAVIYEVNRLKIIRKLDGLEDMVCTDKSKLKN